MLMFVVMRMMMMAMFVVMMMMAMFVVMVMMRMIVVMVAMFVVMVAMIVIMVMMRISAFRFPMFTADALNVHGHMRTPNPASFIGFCHHLDGTHPVLMDIQCVKSLNKGFRMRQQFEKGADDHVAGCAHRTIQI